LCRSEKLDLPALIIEKRGQKPAHQALRAHLTHRSHKCLRTIRRFGSENSVVSCAVFLASLGSGLLALDHPNGILDFRACLRFDLRDLTFGFVENTAFAQALVGTAAGCDLPDHLPPYMLWPFLLIGVARIDTYDVFIAMQQQNDFRHISHIRRSAVDMIRVQGGKPQPGHHTCGQYHTVGH